MQNIPQAEGSKTDGWCASHPRACCGRQPVYPASQKEWFCKCHIYGRKFKNLLKTKKTNNNNKKTKTQHYKRNSLTNKTLLTKLHVGIKPQSIFVYKSVSEKLDLQTLRWHG